MSNPIGSSRFVFFAIILILLGLYLAFDSGILPSAFIRGRDISYTLSVITVTLTLGCTFLALSWIKSLKYWQRTAWWSMASPERRYSLWTTTRSLLLLVMGAWDVIIYFGSADYASSSKYCILISMIAALFCIPGRSEYDRFNK